MSGRRESTEVAPGVLSLGTRWVNFYLVVDGNDALLVDSGYPGYLSQVLELIEGLRIGLSALRAIIVTHHHVDHAGTAEALRVRSGANVHVHPDDAGEVRGEQRSHPPSGFYSQSWRPSMIRYLAHTVGAGGARYRPVSEVRLLGASERLDLPGRPRVVATPGHTMGHCSVFLEDRGTLICGDALVNFDYASGQSGVKLHRFNEDRQRAFASLERFDALDAETILFGHGAPWRNGLDRALDLAREPEAAGR